MPDILGKALYEAVDESFMILGKSSRKIIFEYLKECHSTRSVAPLDWAEAVTDVLWIALGHAGKPLSKVIAEEFYQKLGIDFQERHDWSLFEYVKDADKKLEEQDKHFQKSLR